MRQSGTYIHTRHLSRILPIPQHSAQRLHQLPPPLFTTMAPRNSTTTSTTANKLPLKILMLHGFTQSGQLFRAKTGALTKAITKAFPLHDVSFSFPTGPLRLNPSDVPGYTPTDDDEDKEDTEIESYGWWRRPSSTTPPVEYRGIEDAFASVAQTLKDEGPFDGVIGFSQGASLAFAVASLLEDGSDASFQRALLSASMYAQDTTVDEQERQRRRADIPAPYPQSFYERGGQSTLKFAIIYSGFKFVDRRYRALYETPVRTPVLHVMGSLDALVSEAMGRELVVACAGPVEQQGRVVFHPGGHFVPSQKRYLDVAVGFIRNALEKKGSDDEYEDEEDVEDMDVPF